MNNTDVDKDALEYINSLDWYHSIELPGGIVTHGNHPPSKTILSVMDSIDFKGKKVLDIGCWDGLWSFESEKRGASTVYATDDISQSWKSKPTFEIAHKVLKSKALYEPHVSVYDVDKLGETDFDIILFLGVYYHLKHPLYAFSKLRRICKDGGILLTEGPAFASRSKSYANFYYNQWFVGDASNWWVPSVKCLREMIECSFFEIESDNRLADLKYKDLPRTLLRRTAMTLLNYPKRYIVKSSAVSRADLNYQYPDFDLIKFDKNDYSNMVVDDKIVDAHCDWIDRINRRIGKLIK